MELSNRLTDQESHALLDRLFPFGFAGPDVLAELAPAGWDQSPLLACCHPSLEQIREESRQFHRNLERLRALTSRGSGTERAEVAPADEVTSDATTSEHAPAPVRPTEELTELIGMCLWDVFSDNHEVMTADGRVADIGSFRGASAFLDEHLTTTTAGAWSEGDYLRFYMGTVWVAQRADLGPVDATIFRRRRAGVADWVCHFPTLHLLGPGSLREPQEQRPSYSPNGALAAERAAAARDADIARTRTELDEANARAREAAV